MGDRILQDFVGDVRVLCLAGNLRNDLMWLNYAQSHQGFCVEIDMDILRNHLRNKFEPYLNGADIVDFSVIYRENMPIIRPAILESDGQLFAPIQYKSLEWSYEEEWRFVVYGKIDFDPNPIPVDAITRVLLGCQISEAHRDEIMSVVRREFPHTSILQARRTPYDFGLAFDDVTDVRS